jgi:3-(3-hydroxy-phenyl)propionate hydroxylase
MMMDDRRILIAGGGPVGLLAALMLGRAGLAVRLFDENSEPQADPRAATTHPGTLEVLAEADLVDSMAEVGFVAPIVQFWDRPSGRKVAEFDHGLLSQDTRFPYVIQCEQFKTAKLILERLRTLPNVEVLHNHKVEQVTQRGDAVTIAVRGTNGTDMHSGAYLIGADGGRSNVRKQCGIDFEGFTWPERFIVLTTPFDFEAERGYCPRSYFADPDEWCNCFKVSANGPPGLWRTVYPVKAEQTDEEVMTDEAVQARLQKFFPAATPYEIIHRNLYVTHQRVATSFRHGRVFLAGDAAHVNNPIGGMGLNGGLQDAVSLTKKLIDVILNGATDRLLDLYDLQRRYFAVEFVQEQTIANKRQLEERDPDIRRKNLDNLTAIAAEPERARQFLLRASMITSLRRAEAMTFETR